MEDNHKEFFTVAQKLREDLLFQREIQIHKDYTLSTIIKKESQVQYKVIVLSKNGLEKQYNIANFPVNQEFPKFHPDTVYILKEFTSKLCSISPIESGLYSLMPQQNRILGHYNYRSQNGFNKFALMLCLTPNRKKILTITKEQEGFFDQFVEKYKEYSFPSLNHSGEFNFSLPLNHLGHIFSLYVPNSNHEFIKGFETNYI